MKEQGESTELMNDQISTQPDNNNYPITRHLQLSDFESYMQRRRVGQTTSGRNDIEDGAPHVDPIEVIIKENKVKSSREN